MGSIPTRSRHAPAGDALSGTILTRMPLSARRALRTLGVAAALCLLAVPAARAQRTDTARAGVAPRPARRQQPAQNPAAQPPISPRRAFLYSLLVPGLGQSRLDRPTAGTIFVAAEAASIVMAAKSAFDLREAKRLAGPDSVIVGYQPPATPGGEPVPIFAANRWSNDRVRARRLHYEDWIATIVFNHFFAGADAFVAAQLWDLPTRVSVRATPQGTAVATSIAW